MQAYSEQKLAEIRSPSEVPVPLCRRPAEHVEKLEDLLSWRSDVLQRIQGVGDAFESSDGGPGGALLQVRSLQTALLGCVFAATVNQLA